ncbi:hypothetical protein CEXT_669731 [Caerostris extrusa]|uniref:Uncharacterized protein n=1 Tax=Caerostris extrusa TaxID=172846 RepID=A0AAV4XUM0_CAEEX|nr:hypothetical protein CEXT_669731 [Caerostris extrusa]
MIIYGYAKACLIQRQTVGMKNFQPLQLFGVPAPIHTSRPILRLSKQAFVNSTTAFHIEDATSLFKSCFNSNLSWFIDRVNLAIGWISRAWWNLQATHRNGFKKRS